MPRIRHALLALLLFTLPALSAEIPPGYIRGQVYARDWQHLAPQAVITLYDPHTGLPVASTRANVRGEYVFEFRDLGSLYEVRYFWIGAEWKDEVTPLGMTAWVRSGTAIWCELRVE